MSDSGSRREAQKARTRARILTAAQDLFAERGFDAVTVIEIAATARVSVQTVFNHFAGKEELFFSERADWVEGPAAAVRDRGPGERAKTALRRHLVASVEGYARAASDPGHRRMVDVLDRTPALLAYERGLHEEAVSRLGAALADSSGRPGRSASDVACTTVLAEVTASVWMAAVRSIVMDLRTSPPATGVEDLVRAYGELTDRVLTELDSGLSLVDVPAYRVARSVA